MSKLRRFSGRHVRKLLLLASGLVLFLLWLGLWLRVLPDRPRVSIPAPEHSEVVGVSNDGRWVVTRMRHPPPEPPPGYMVTQYSSPSGPIRVWDMEREAIAAEFLGPEDSCQMVVVSCDGRFVIVQLSRSGMNQTRIFDAHTGRELKISPLRGDFYFTRFSPDGRFLAEPRSDERVIDIWDLIEERKRLELVGDGPTVEFSGDSALLVVGHYNREAGQTLAVVKEVSGGKEVRRFLVEALTLSHVCFSPDNRRLALFTQDSLDWAGCSDVVIYDLTSGEQIERYGDVVHFAFLPSGAAFVRVWSEEESSSPPTSDGFEKTIPSRGGRYVLKYAWGMSQSDGVKSNFLGKSGANESEYVELRTPDSGRLVLKLEGCSQCWFRLSDDESVAACIGPTGHIEVWDLPPRRPLFTLLALAALPASLFTAVIWWRLGRG